MIGQRVNTAKSLRFVVQKRDKDMEPFEEWLRVRGFPRREQAATYIKKHPGETYRIRDIREQHT